MIYTALGDSITFGEDASSNARSYPQLIVSALSSRSRKADGQVVARPGWSSGDLLDALSCQDDVIGRSSVVSVWIGGVDLANAALLSFRRRQAISVKPLENNYRRNLSAILTRIKKGSRARIVCCTQYNPFPNSPAATQWIDQLNRIITETARGYQANVAPAHRWFEGRQAELIHGYRHGTITDALSGSLPIHPNDRGHRVIASALTPYIASR